MPGCFICKFNNNMPTIIKYFKDVNANNKVILEFDIDNLNFDGDYVAISNNVDVDNVGRIVNFSNLGNKRSERVDVNNLGIERSVGVDATGDEYVDYEEEEEDDDYTSYNEE
uniref:Uncharacterized protein n=1 Tax=Populus alba TaxID=43335 RepID=A0A4U5QH24_POPAL|nr:hypothetical protein D5086_0000094760 [Populus alba]